MKIAIFQPVYPKSYDETLAVMEQMKSAADNCPDDIDLIVFPEYSNCPGMHNMEEMKKHCHKHNDDFLSSFIASAAKNQTAISINMLVENNNGYTNTTYFIGNSGEISAEYKKTHLSHPEISSMNLIPGTHPVFVKFQGCKITFAVCFELYFPEYFETLASVFPDIIICPSYQRSENSGILLKQAAGRALDSEAFIIRASYSMGKDSLTGGMSYVINPSGDVLLNAGQETGLFTVKVNPAEKRLRPLAYGLDKISSRHIVETFRIPSLYRKNSNTIKPLSSFDYPRVCAHRGLSGLVPENTLPAFAASVALGADEIEFDIRLTKDNKMVVCHDGTVDRVSNKKGNVSDLSFEEIRKLNAGYYMNWIDIKFPTPEEIFRLCAGQIIMNIHIYEAGDDGFVINRLADLIEKYDIQNYVYFAAQEEAMDWCVKNAPDIERCMLECFDKTRDIIDIALKYDCKRVQHFYRNYSIDAVKKAHKSGLVNNLFYEDDPSMANFRIKEGIDTILTNYADRIIPILKD